jgi:hypothetical protein
MDLNGPISNSTDEMLSLGIGITLVSIILAYTGVECIPIPIDYSSQLSDDHITRKTKADAHAASSRSPLFFASCKCRM